MKVYKLGTKTCSICMAVEQNLKNAGINFESIDLDDNPELVEKLGIKSIPVILYGGEDTALTDCNRLNGFQSVSQLKKILG